MLHRCWHSIPHRPFWYIVAVSDTVFCPQIEWELEISHLPTNPHGVSVNLLTLKSSHRQPGPLRLHLKKSDKRHIIIVLVALVAATGDSRLAK